MQSAVRSLHTGTFRKVSGFSEHLCFIFSEGSVQLFCGKYLLLRICLNLEKKPTPSPRVFVFHLFTVHCFLFAHLLSVIELKEFILKEKAPKQCSQGNT